MSTRLTGRAAAPGAALAPAFVVTPQPSIEDDLPKERTGTAEEETARLRAALERAEEELREIARTIEVTAGEAEAGIFEAQAEF
ncbi:MAG TPA: phosphoenolpyruvate-utilizing N-terminal domain-containing protein, partial [Actinomycetota bacterium]